MRVEIENPYESPQTIAAEKVILQTSFLRGMVMAMIWGGAAFVIAPLSVAITRSTFLNDVNQYRLSEIFPQFQQFLGLGIFLGILFSLSAIANYTPVVRVGFIRTLLWTLLAFLTSSFLVVIGSIPFEWPLSPPPQRYGYTPTIEESLWSGVWFYSGTVMFTAYLLWLRIRMPASLWTSAPTQSKMEAEVEIE